MKSKLKAWFWTSGRFFAVPFFGGALLCGVVLAGGRLGSLNTWLAFACATLTMAGGHILNTWGDWKTGLDKPSERSAEKAYTAGCGLIAEGIMSARETFINGMMWYALSAIPMSFLATRVGWIILIPWVLGMGISFWYTLIAKFNYTHELALASGPVAAAVLGALSVGSGEWFNTFLVALPIVMIFSFGGLALDEWPDAEANLKKGVRSLAYKVWEYKIDLGTYLMLWFIMAFMVQILLISIGILKPLTGITFFCLPSFLAACVFLKSNIEFRKVAMAIVLIAMLYPILLLVGQAVGGV